MNNILHTHGAEQSTPVVQFPNPCTGAASPFAVGTLLKVFAVNFRGERVFSRSWFCRLRIRWVSWNNGCKTPGDDASDELTPSHSITSSARARSQGGTVSPSILAIWALMPRIHKVGSVAHQPTNLGNLARTGDHWNRVARRQGGELQAPGATVGRHTPIRPRVAHSENAGSPSPFGSAAPHCKVSMSTAISPSIY